MKNIQDSILIFIIIFACISQSFCVGVSITGSGNNYVYYNSTIESSAHYTYSLINEKKANYNGLAYNNLELESNAQLTIQGCSINNTLTIKPNSEHEENLSKNDQEYTYIYGSCITTLIVKAGCVL